MHRPRLVHLVVSLCFLYLPLRSLSGQVPVQFPSNVAVVDSRFDDIVSNAAGSDLPHGMLEIMRASRLKYLEGSSLIKAGNSEKARQLFNEAVDMILKSNWDLASTPELDRFFQDLIQRIQQDESFYLLGPSENDNQIENAIIDDLDDLDLIPIKIDPTLKDDLIADLAKTKYGIPITFNEMVAKSIDYWLNRGRKSFVDGLLRSGKYRPLIEKVFREESIPLDLMYLAQVESCFKPNAVSKAHAKGIWQFEKGTAIRYGLKVNRYIDERSDPEKSTRAAARYLNDLFAMFKDWNLALAAYNWGEGKVQRLINSTGLKDFWQLVDLRRRLPKETRNHVPLIQASVILARNPEKYDLPTKLDPPLKYVEVSVSKPIDLRAAAIVLRTTFDELKDLNPALRGYTTPADYPDYQLKIPVGTGPEAHVKLNSLPAAPVWAVENYVRHKIRRGETLSGIAAKYHVSISELEIANNISSKHIIIAGKWLYIPKLKSSAGAGTKKSGKKKGKKGSTALTTSNRPTRTKSTVAATKISPAYAREGAASEKPAIEATASR